MTHVKKKIKKNIAYTFVKLSRLRAAILEKEKKDTYRKAVQNDTGWMIILKQRAPFHKGKYSLININ